MIDDIESLARSRRAELVVGLAWYAFSAILIGCLTSSGTALTAMAMPEAASWLGRLAVLPGLGMLGGMVFLLRHQWRARAVVDRVIGSNIPRVEPILVFASVVGVATLGWIARPRLDPVAFCIGVLLFSVPLVWAGIRCPGRTTLWVWPTAMLCLLAAGVLGGLEVRYGPLTTAPQGDLMTVVSAVTALALGGLVLAFGVLGLALVGYIRAARGIARADLDGVAALSHGGLLDDSAFVLEAHRLRGDPDETIRRYRRFVSILPMAGPIHVLADAMADRADPRAAEIAASAVDAFPMSQSALLVYARVFRASHPEAALAAIIDGNARSVGGDRRRPVFDSLEGLLLARLGQTGPARRRLVTLELGEHPVYAQEARLFAAEGWCMLGEPERAEALLAEVDIPAFVARFLEATSGRRPRTGSLHS